MAPRVRRECRLALPAPPPPRRTGACVGLKLRAPARESAPALGALMLDAHLGTIDYEGEDLAASVGVVEAYFDGTAYRPLLEGSVVAWRGDVPVCACLAAWWGERGCPFVAHIMTRRDSARAGIGRLLLSESARRISRMGYRELRAVITEGNVASEALFRRVGFEDLGRLGPKPPARPTA